MRIVTETGFGANAKLLIELRDSQGDYVLSAGHKVRVVLGGKEAELIPGTVLTYSISADGLKNHGKGGVALNVIVEQKRFGALDPPPLSPGSRTG